jgi:hypothetical protein
MNAQNAPYLALALSIGAAVVLSSCGKEAREDAPPTASTPLPALPAWAAPILGKKVDAIYANSTACKGHTDLKQLHDGSPAGFWVEGWAWDAAGKVPAARIVFTDSNTAIVGAAAGGVKDRPDVSKALPDVTSPKTGWAGSIEKSGGKVTAFAITADNKACQFDTVNLDQ